jgi:hypothetical protein
VVLCYFSIPSGDQPEAFTYLMVLFKEEMNDPNMIGVMLLFLILFYIFVGVMGFPSKAQPLSLEIIELK